MIKELWCFLGLTSYYQRFIPSFAIITHPLWLMTHKGTTISWDNRATEAFELLKQKLCTTLILVQLDFSKSFILYMDISKLRLGTILL